MKKGKIFVIMGVCAAMLCGCQKTPDDAFVTSKNDGAFETAIESQTESANSTDVVNEGNQSVYAESFQSADNSINYTVELTEPTEDSVLPVLQVTPETITSEMAERVARVLFGDANIYQYSSEMSKSEIEDRILSLRKHISNYQSLVEYYGGDEEIADRVKAEFEAKILEYESAYEQAAEEVFSTLCDWVFYPQSYYDDPSISHSHEEGYDETQCIKATTTLDGLPYVYNVYNRDAKDYRIHSIYAYVNDMEVAPIEMYSTEEPSEEDIKSAIAKAEELLAQMDIGEWEIASSGVVTWGDYDSGKNVYKIEINATPVYNGVKVTRQHQLANLKSEDAYASNYYYEEVLFTFSGERLVEFQYKAPLEVVDEINSNVEILPFGEVINSLKAQMRLSSAYYYLGADMVDIAVDEVELGLSRIRIKNNESDFYLVPTYTFYGNADMYDQSGEPIIIYDAQGNPTTEGLDVQLATINAVDGSVINVELGY